MGSRDPRRDSFSTLVEATRWKSVLFRRNRFFLGDNQDLARVAIEPIESDRPIHRSFFRPCGSTINLSLRRERWTEYLETRTVGKIVATRRSVLE